MPLFAAILVVVGWFTVNWLASRRERASEKRKAAAEYRASILTATRGFYPLALRWPSDFEQPMEAMFPEIQLAIERYRPFLDHKDQSKLREAWFTFRLGEGGAGASVAVPYHFMPYSSNPDPAETFRRAVEALLAFAP